MPMTAAALAPIAPRLGHLLRRALGSDQNGEIVAAIHATKRVLGSLGADYHDFVALVESSAETIARLKTENSDLRTRLATVTADLDAGADEDEGALDWKAKRDWLISERWDFLRLHEQKFMRDLGKWRGKRPRSSAIGSMRFTSVSGSRLMHRDPQRQLDDGNGWAQIESAQAVALRSGADAECSSAWEQTRSPHSLILSSVQAQPADPRGTSARHPLFASRLIRRPRVVRETFAGGLR
jgi:hypothetical protein